MSRELWLRAWRSVSGWSGWSALVRWKLWRKLFVIHPLLSGALAAVSGAALVWIFSGGYERRLFSIPVYVLSAYGLITVCTGVSGVLRWGHGFVNRYAFTRRYVHDGEFRFTLGLYGEQGANAFYGIFKTLSGAALGSGWILWDGIYNLSQAVIQLIQILRRRKNLTLLQQWKSYRFCGWLILGLHLAVAVLVFQMTRLGAAEEYPGVQIFATAAFAFYKLITAAVDVARDRKSKAPIDSSVLLLDLAQALFSLFSLQVAMIRHFGGSQAFGDLMNHLTGTAVCSMILAMGLYMLRRSRREMEKLEGAIHE